MNKEQIFKAITKVCEQVEKIIKDENGIIDCGIPIACNEIDNYSIASVSETSDGRIAISIHFHAAESNTWHGKFYFVREEGKNEFTNVSGGNTLYDYK